MAIRLLTKDTLYPLLRYESHLANDRLLCISLNILEWSDHIESRSLSRFRRGACSGREVVVKVSAERNDEERSDEQTRTNLPGFRLKLRSCVKALLLMLGYPETAAAAPDCIIDWLN